MKLIQIPEYILTCDKSIHERSCSCWRECSGLIYCSLVTLPQLIQLFHIRAGGWVMFLPNKKINRHHFSYCSNFLKREEGPQSVPHGYRCLQEIKICFFCRIQFFKTIKINRSRNHSAIYTHRSFIYYW